MLNRESKPSPRTRSLLGSRKAAVPLVAGLAAGLTAGTASAQTWTYDADVNQSPNAAGQPFEGATVAGANSTRSLIDLGGGDYVFQINTIDPNTDQASYFEQGNVAGPATNQWDVNNTTGYSVIWNMQADPGFALEQGSADIIAGDGAVAPVLRLYKNTASSPLAVRYQNIVGTGIIDKLIGNPDAYHTYRMDVLNGNVNIYLDDYAFPIISTTAAAGAFDFLRFGDGTGAGDGKHNTQFLSTYQNGIAPVPTAPDARALSHQTFLAHYDGNTANGGLDADFAAGNATAVGTGGVISSNSKFGSGSLDGNSASGTVRYDTAGNYNLSSGTVEMWADADNWAAATTEGFFSIFPGSGNDIRLQKTASGQLQAYMAGAGEVWSLTSNDLSAAFADGEFHHLAWTWDFNANVAALYLDGVVIDDTIAYSAGLNGVIDYDGTLGSEFEVGTVQNGSASFVGVIDEFRLSNIDLYGGQNFTPQTLAYDPIPEPGTLGLIGAGLLLTLRRRSAA